MAPTPTISPTTGNPVPPHYLHASSAHFQDTKGRTVLLRGINLSGAAKNPPKTPSWRQERFWQDAEEGKVSFVGATLDLEDGSADIHLARLRAWGFNVLRFVFMWEALEHAGPGKYDYEYMDYVVKVLRKCKAYGFRVYMDPHQDVWSRFSGGSGAPIWSIYACGIDPLNIVATYAALVHSDYPNSDNPDPKSLPAMIWSSNYYRAFGHTVWTLFFAGKTFAPKCIIDGVNIQDWLQDHFINACAELAKVIAKAGDLYDETVIGWDSINEPGEGMIRIRDLSVVPKHQPVKLGSLPSPFDNMRLAMGEAIEVDNMSFGPLGPVKDGKVVLDPKGLKLWLKPEDEVTRGGGKWGWKRDPGWKLGTCIWAQHGVWDIESKKLLKPAYFLTYPTEPEREVDFVPEFWRDHWIKYGAAIRAQHPEAIHFLNTTVFKALPTLPETSLGHRACSSAHYYDGLTLMTRHWWWYNADALGLLRGKYWSVIQSLRIGEANIRQCMQDQLGIIREDTHESLGTYPTLIGEIGCPFDMDGKRAYGNADNGKGKGDYSSQQKAWDCSLNACDGPNALNYTMWTYVPNHSHEWGDNWNAEDLSVWSRDDIPRPSGGSDGYQMTSSTESFKMTDSTGLLARSMSSDASGSTLVPLSGVSPQSIASGQGVTPRLILDGARAVAAVCRPYPVATVGVPERIDFDIASSRFKLSVRVRPEDAPKDGEYLVTEVFVPFVHYAGNLDRDWSSQTIDKSGSQVSLGNSSDDEYDKGSASVEELASPSLSKDQTTVGLKLDIETKVSAGSVTTAGQYLRWHYPVPNVQQGARVYTLEIVRRGGSLHAKREQGGWGDMLNWCSVQ